MDKDALDIGVLIADRLTFFRRGMAGLLQEAWPGWHLEEADSFEAVQAYMRGICPDLMLLDLGLPGLIGATGIRRLRDRYPDLRIVVMADSDERATILDCLTAGANGYVLKSATPAQFLRALDTVLSGGVFAPAALTGAPLRAPSVPVAMSLEGSLQPALASMTDRQRDVFRLLAEGCATKTIARRLDLAVGTVKVHLAAIYRLLGAHSRLEAMAKACGGGVLPAGLPQTAPATVRAQPVPVRERLN
jgi:DNA-binding NarL/FixJ family response regulator